MCPSYTYRHSSTRWGLLFLWNKVLDFIQPVLELKCYFSKIILYSPSRDLELLVSRNINLTVELYFETCFQVVREHDPLGRDVELFRRHLYGAGKVGPVSKGTEGLELVDGLVIKEEDYKLVKTRFSAFFATHLHSVLQGAGINSLVITGE